MAGRKVRFRSVRIQGYLKASILSYPWTPDKSAKAELKAQLQLHW